VFVGSCNGFFRALERQTGHVRWSHDTGQDGHAVQFHSDPIVIDDLVVTGTDLIHGSAPVYAFERETGRVRWKRELGSGTGADVLRVGSMVCAATLDDQVFCLDARTGKTVWESEPVASGEEPHDRTALAASGDRIFFGDREGAVRAFDVNSGQVLWKKDLGAGISTSVVHADGSLYAGTSNRRLFRLDPATGTTTAELATEGEPIGRMLFADHTLVAFVSETRLVGFDSSLKSARWSQTGSWTSARPYARKDAVVAGNREGELSAFRISDGARLWSTKLEGAVRSVGFSGDDMYVGTIPGRVYAFSAGGT